MFLYIKKGYPELFHASSGGRLLQEGQYYLLCIPSDSHPQLLLQPGTYRFLQLDVLKEDLLDMGAREEQEMLITKYRVNTETHGFCLFQGAISPDIRYSIRQLKQSAPRNKLEAKLQLSYQQSMLMQIFIDHFLQQSMPDAVTDDQRLLEAISYIKANIHDARVIRNTAIKLCVSTDTLRRLFHKHLGMPPRYYLLEYRMKYALLLIQTTDLSLESIAYELGYLEYSNFYAQFVSYYKTNPETFLKQYRYA